MRPHNNNNCTTASATYPTTPAHNHTTSTTSTNNNTISTDNLTTTTDNLTTNLDNLTTNLDNQTTSPTYNLTPLSPQPSVYSSPPPSVPVCPHPTSNSIFNLNLSPIPPSSPSQTPHYMNDTFIRNNDCIFAIPLKQLNNTYVFNLLPP